MFCYLQQQNKFYVCYPLCQEFIQGVELIFNDWSGLVGSACALIIGKSQVRLSARQVQACLTNLCMCLRILISPEIISWVIFVLRLVFMCNEKIGKYLQCSHLYFYILFDHAHISTSSVAL